MVTELSRSAPGHLGCGEEKPYYEENCYSHGCHEGEASAKGRRTKVDAVISIIK